MKNYDTIWVIMDRLTKSAHFILIRLNYPLERLEELYIEKIRKGEVAYHIALPPLLDNLHDVFHVSQMRRYILNLSRVIQVDDVHVRDNLTIEASPIQIEGREVKQLRGKEITLVKVAWGGPSGGNMTWKLDGQMRKSYLNMFP
ncbi:uncharacterized protein LOC127095850 [Lathyrus oleraceus]|uniref:uncharacterized protein LOC127095850 n=1 Tax=Pisum sativum TaxID=3888 RepID=UPI0021D216BB|nr:uncharacterized protein LOC127095850 [Pisum sativum]